MQFHLFSAASPITRTLMADHMVPTVEPLRISPWLAMSALQKGIRRADVDLATRAAATLLRSDPARLWRRLAGIVVEDIGLADLECVRLVIAATTGKGFRSQFGGEHRVAGLVIARMCQAKKCRATDDLFIAVSHHHELEAVRADLAGCDLPQHLSHVRERSALLGCAIASLHASGVRWTGQFAGKVADPKALFKTIRDAGADHEIVALAEQGYRKTREPLPLLLPLLSFALPSGELPAVDDDLPPVVIGRNGIPTYCLDGFSHEGKAALARALRRDLPTSRWLRRHVPAERRLAVLAGGLFRIEGGLVRQRVEWPCAATLKWLADSGYHDMKLSDPAGFLDLVRADLPAIDEERANVR
jgi:hypothetical protein